MEIEGPRVELAPLTVEDVDNVMTWVNNQEVIKNFQNFKGFTREEEQAFIAKILSSDNDVMFSILRKSDGVYIGQCGINQISWPNKLGRLSITITTRHQGQKYFQEVIPLLIDYAYKVLKLHKVWVMFYKTNERMWHLCNKLEFVLEADMPDEYYWNNEWHDIIRMAKINW